MTDKLSVIHCTRLHPLHKQELENVWLSDQRLPTLESRKAWALARGLEPNAVNVWWHRKRAHAIKGKRKPRVPSVRNTYEIPVGIPPSLSLHESPTSSRTSTPQIQTSPIPYDLSSYRTSPASSPSIPDEDFPDDLAPEQTESALDKHGEDESIDTPVLSARPCDRYTFPCSLCSGHDALPEDYRPRLALNENASHCTGLDMLNCTEEVKGNSLWYSPPASSGHARLPSWELSALPFEFCAQQLGYSIPFLDVGQFSLDNVLFSLDGRQLSGVPHLDDPTTSANYSEIRLL